MKKVTVYVDGSSVDVNAKMAGVEAEWHGAYGAVFYEEGREVLRMRGYEKGGTIGKMELTALLSTMRKAYQMSYGQVEIFGDNQYVVNGATRWLRGWNKKKFKDIKFPELWREVDIMLQNTAVVYDIKWVRGHNGDAGNEAVDKVAREALGQGITEWKVSGKESWVMFDVVGSASESIGYTILDSEEYVKMGETGWTTKSQLAEFKKADEAAKADEKRVWFGEDKVEIEPGIFASQESLGIAAAHRREIHDTFPEMVKKKPDGWIKEMEQKVAEQVRKENEEWFAATHRKINYERIIEVAEQELATLMEQIKSKIEFIVKIKIQKEKQDGTHSTGNKG